MNLIAAPGYTVTITDMTTASTAAASATFNVEFFTRAGNALGGPVGSGPGSSPAGWTSLGIVQVTQGPTTSGVSLLFSTPTIVIDPGDTVGMAMLFTGAGPRYFGTGTPPYETYSNTGLTCVTGDGRSAPFTPTGSFFSSRAHVGEIHYDAVVPVELASFTASVLYIDNSNYVELSWATATELNNQGFSVERKNSSTEWISLGFIEGMGTTTETHIYSFKDNNVATGTYSYRLKQIDFDGSFRYYELSDIVEVSTPFAYNLLQNYPNPFNPSTTISWQLKNDGMVTIKVYDQLGKEVATLVNEEKPAGSYEIEFNESSLASGVYYYRINAGSFVDTKKMILMK
jgi:Secretion system C-terminal sorting domain